MKKDEITALGITEEQADKVLAIYESEAAKSQEKLAELQAKLTAAEKNAAELTEKVKSFDGVDIAALKKSAEDWEAKYNADLTAAKVNAAVELALTKAGAKDVSLAKHLIDTSIVKLDGDRLVGLEEQLTKAKADKAFLFEGEDTAGLPTVNTGMEHGAPTGTGMSAELMRSVMGLSSDNK